MKIKLTELEIGLKKFLFYYLVTITIGIIAGLVFLGSSTDYSLAGTVENIRGSENDEDFNIVESYPKAAADLLVTTHNHIIGFAFLILSVGLIFYFNNSITGIWKNLLMIEPLISSVITFGSIWLIRFIHPEFVWLTIVSSVLLYLCLFIMIGTCIYELKFKN